MLKTERVEILSYAYEPLYFSDWTDAISDVFSGRAEVVEEHETLRIGVMDGNTVSSIALPKVIRFKTGIPAAKLFERLKLKFSRQDLYIRDDGRCQYCDKKLAKDSCTIDHVVPRAAGGITSWENCVLACSSCNTKKGSKNLEETSMFLTKTPTVPKAGQIQYRKRLK